jgi:hypothetical protein
MLWGRPVNQGWQAGAEPCNKKVQIQLNNFGKQKNIVHLHPLSG